MNLANTKYKKSNTATATNPEGNRRNAGLVCRPGYDGRCKEYEEI